MSATLSFRCLFGCFPCSATFFGNVRIRRPAGSLGGVLWWGWRVADRVTDTLVTGLSCLVADMKPVDSSDHRPARDASARLAFVWMGNDSHTVTLMAADPGRGREATEPMIHDHLSGVPIVLEGKITRSEATTIHERTDRDNQALSTQVRTFSTDRLVRHTHLQRVASCIQLSGGGGWC